MANRKKSEKTKMIEKLDVLWSTAVRTRDNYHCQKEGCPACGPRNSQAAHIWSRGHMKTRWNLDDGITLCYYHHIIWSHRQPLEFAEWVKERLGESKYYQLRDLALRDTKPLTKEDMEEIYETLLREIKKIQEKKDKEVF